MVQTLKAGEVTLGDLAQNFGLVITHDRQFFSEWTQASIEVTEEEIRLLERVRSNYENLITFPPVSEEAVKMVVLSPLLDLAGFYQAPFRIKTEVGTQISSLDEDGTVVTGQIDVLVISELLWVVVVESKMSRFSLTAALPQILSYMLASPHSECFGLIANGSEFVFVKLIREGTPTYSLSRVFSLLTPGNELVDVVRILKHLGQTVIGR
ncbi:MAG: restriction endonuclease subunit R [Leptolyngbyaceae cyanobacterium SM1_3_5]|nr:restriction endonuclease subunit R [Leptolyngbyaceae cyanobacterium SM1_3_5]